MLQQLGQTMQTIDTATTHSAPGAADNLRFALREVTAAAHDLLDNSMREASGWTTREDYLRFLTLQYAARAPVEAWLSEHAPTALCPPAQSPLIADDLIKAGAAVPAIAGPFTLAGRPSHHRKADMADTAAAEALGAAWVLAGSSLGNRAILKELRRAASDEGRDQWPASFLADPAMLQFWQTLRRRIERPASKAEVGAASRAALAVFDHFTEFVAPGSAEAPDPTVATSFNDLATHSAAGA